MKSSKPRELNYKGQFHSLEENKLYKAWIYHSLQDMLETIFYVNRVLEKTLILLSKRYKIIGEFL